ncbi:MAG: hypothetical protein ACE5HX_11935 [bacterium]
MSGHRNSEAKSWLVNGFESYIVPKLDRYIVTSFPSFYLGTNREQIGTRNSAAVSYIVPKFLLGNKVEPEALLRLVQII